MHSKNNQENKKSNLIPINLPVKNDVDKRFDGEKATLIADDQTQKDNININTMDTQTEVPQANTSTETLEIKKLAAEPAKASQLSIEQRVDLLEKNVERLNYRTQWQEQLHRNVGEDGNISHYYNIIPSIIIAAGTGVVIGLAIKQISEYIKNN